MYLKLGQHSNHNYEQNQLVHVQAPCSLHQWNVLVTYTVCTVLVTFLMFSLRWGRVSEPWSYLFLHINLYYKMLYWSDSQTKQVINVKPALVSPVVFTCFPKGCAALWNTSSNTLLYARIQVDCECRDSSPSHTVCHRAYMRETEFAHCLKCYFPNRRCETLLKLGAKYTTAEQMLQRGRKIYSFYRK